MTKTIPVTDCTGGIGPQTAAELASPQLTSRSYRYMLEKTIE